MGDAVLGGGTVGGLERVMRPVTEAAFEQRIRRTARCWQWLGPTQCGYGFVWRGRSGRYAHRVVYERERGSIPDGMTLDHLCRNRDCVNQDHLEPVTLRENILRGDGPPAHNARKTHCDRHGTPLTQTTSQRHCAVCAREAKRRYKLRRKLVSA